MKVEPKSIEVDGPVCDLLLQRIGRPKNLVSCRAINVYDNKYRINVYTKAMVDDIETRRMTYSCAARLMGDKDLQIIMETPNYSGIAL